MLFPSYFQLDSMDCGRRAYELLLRFTVGIIPCKTFVIAAISRGKVFRC